MKTGVLVASLSTVFALACAWEPLRSDPGASAGAGGTGGPLSSSGAAPSGGPTGGSPTSAATAPSDFGTFVNGRGVGVMTGYGWVNLGSADTVTAPVCADDPTTPSSTRPITSPVGLCPEAGATVWSNPDSGLCVSGAIPLANSAWEDDWGIRVGAEVSVSGGTLGKRYSTITFNFNLNGVTPTNPAIRGVVHVKDDPAGADTWYCAVIQPGVAVPLASFNPDCWWPDFPGNLAEEEIASIDEIGIQIPSDNSSGYLLNNFCWTGISLAGASVSGTGGAVGAGGSVPPSASGGGGVAGSGGASGMAGSEGGGGMSGSGGSRAAFVMPCTSKQDCSSDANCCDGGSESCDGTKLASGDGTNSGEFVVSADGLTVTDTITGLVWQRDGWGTRAGCSGGADGLGSGNLTCSWSEAQSYCASLTLGGVSGWRLPGRNELSTLVDFTETNPCIDQTAFPNAPSDWFQTSSSNAREGCPVDCRSRGHREVHERNQLFGRVTRGTSSSATAATRTVTTWATPAGCAVSGEDGDILTTWT